MTVKIEHKLITRPATLQDVGAVVQLANAAAIADTGIPATTPEDKLIEWELPQFNLETDTRLVFSPEGRTVGYVELWDSQPHVRHYCWGRVHPDYRQRGVGACLLDWAEKRALASLHKAPPQARVSLHTSTPQQNQAAQTLFQLRGFALARHFFRMRIDMTPGAPPPTPRWPTGVTLRPLALGQDDRRVHRALDQAFQDHWGYVEGESFAEWIHWIENDPKFDPAVCFLAVTPGRDGEEIVGVAMSRLEWEVDPALAWVDELGVLQAWRRKGIALALLQHTFSEFYRRGCYSVGLGVDGDSLTGAARLYEKAGMRVFYQTDAYEKVLRPGQDLSTQTLI